MRPPALRRLLEHEALNVADPPAITAATFRVLERLALQLTPIIGQSGVAAVYSRSFHLARQRIPWLPPVSAAEADRSFTAVRLAMQLQEAGVAMEAAFAVLGALSELLAVFIGESLTTNLLSGAWPDESAAGGDGTRGSGR